MLVFDVFGEVGEAHVAFAAQRVVHGECCWQAMTGVASCAEFEIVPEELLVVGMHAFLDDELCTLHGAFGTQVGHALLGDDDVDVVLRMVLVADEWHDAADESTLGC